MSKNPPPEFSPRLIVNAIARHVEAGEWVTFGQIAEVVEMLTGHHTTPKGVGSALTATQSGGYVPFRVRQADGGFSSVTTGASFDGQDLMVTLARAEGILDPEGVVRVDR